MSQSIANVTYLQQSEICLGGYRPLLIFSRIWMLHSDEDAEIRTQKMVNNLGIGVARVT